MKRFIKKLLAFSFLILALLITLQLLLSFKIKGKTIYGQDNLDQTANINADVVFLGSSRCWKHFDPVFFDTTFHVKSANLGVDGHEELTMMIVRFKNYLSKNLPPKFVVINIDPVCVGGSFEKLESVTMKNFYAGYAFMPDEKNLDVLNYFEFNFYERNIPLYAAFKYNIITDCFRRHPMATNYLKYGYDRRDETWDTLSHPIGSIQKYPFDSTQERGVVWALDSLKKLCIQNNSKLLCIQTPFYKIVDCQVSTPRITQMCAREKIPFIDTNIPAISDSLGNFWDDFHLNTTGVRKLNNTLSKDSVFVSFLDVNKR